MILAFAIANPITLDERGHYEKIVCNSGLIPCADKTEGLCCQSTDRNLLDEEFKREKNRGKRNADDVTTPNPWPCSGLYFPCKVWGHQ